MTNHWKICSPTKICLIPSTEAIQKNLHLQFSLHIGIMNLKLQGYLLKSDQETIFICSLSISTTTIRFSSWWLYHTFVEIKLHLPFPWNINSVPGSRFHHNLNTYNKFFTFMTSVKNSWILTKSWFCHHHQKIIGTKTVYKILALLCLHYIWSRAGHPKLWG